MIKKIILSLCMIAALSFLCADSLSVIADSTAITSNFLSSLIPKSTIEWVTVIISLILLIISIVFANKLSKAKKILSEVSNLFDDIQDSIVDNKISVEQIKTILADIKRIKQEF